MLFGLEDFWQVAAVFAAAVLAGAGNAVAGGGTNLSFPILVWAGLPPVEANATNSVGLSSGSLAAAWSYRERIGQAEASWWWLLTPALVGGGLGAWLLLALPPDWFAAVAPFLVIGAATLVAADPVIRRHLDVGLGQGLGRSVFFTFLVAVYGGYFGAGIGILTLVVLSFMGMHDLHQANAFKNLLAVAMKGVAVLLFILLGRVIWGAAILLILGSVAGGWSAGHLVQKVDPGVLRWLVVAMGLAMGLVMVVSEYVL